MYLFSRKLFNNKRRMLRNLGAGGCWLMPVIRAIYAAEFGRITVQDQPWQVVHETPSPPK
jgi:hypothetical protein